MATLNCTMGWILSAAGWYRWILINHLRRPEHRHTVRIVLNNNLTCITDRQTHTHTLCHCLLVLAPVTQGGPGICTGAIDRRLCQCLTNLKAPGCNWNDWLNPQIKTDSLTTKAGGNPNSALLVELASSLGERWCHHCQPEDSVWPRLGCRDTQELLWQ